MMGWRKRPDGVYIKFSPINNRSNIGAKIEQYDRVMFLATVYITNGNQSQVITIGEQSFSNIRNAKAYCEKCLKLIFDTAWGMLSNE